MANSVEEPSLSTVAYRISLSLLGIRGHEPTSNDVREIMNAAMAKARELGCTLTGAASRQERE